MRAPARVYTRCAPPDNADLTDRRNGKAESRVLAAPGAIAAPVLVERANPEVIGGSPGLLEDAVMRTRFSIAAMTGEGIRGSAFCPVTLVGVVEARKQTRRPEVAVLVQRLRKFRKRCRLRQS